MKIFKKYILSTLILLSSPIVFMGTAYSEPKVETVFDQEEKGVDQLLSIIEKRLIIMHEIAKHKWNNTSPIDDPLTENIRLKKYVGMAKSFGLTPKAVASILKGQIEAEKSIQMKDFESWIEEKKNSHDIHAVKLTELNYQLDQLTDQLFLTWKKLLPFSEDPSFNSLLQERANDLFKEGEIDQEVISEAIAPFLSGPTKG